MMKIGGSLPASIAAWPRLFDLLARPPLARALGIMNGDCE